ncbi:MAG: branched-chain amino acid ABC transporter permease [Sphaerochaeta sp.]|nr:branched-chain amino acid ABC transporter permease [Sphaerochaeta sp.]
MKHTLLIKLKDKDWDLLLIAAIFLAMVPIFTVNLVIDLMIFSIFVLGYNLLYGYMGRLSVGHMLYLGTGAYGAAMFIAYINPNPFLAIIFGALCGMVIGLILGPIIVRTNGACFALINLAFNQVGFFLIQTGFAKWTGGEDGKSAYFDKVLFMDFYRPNHVFFLVLIILVLVVLFVKKLTRSPFGILVRSIKENETRARFLGYNTFRGKLWTFTLSTSISALAGALYTINYAYVTPSFIAQSRNVEVIFATLIGGAGSIYGSLVGGVVFIFIVNLLPNIIQRWEMFLGIILLIVVFRFDKGIWGSITSLYNKRKSMVKIQKGA